ncbi:PepSY domain-containing protein [Methanobacterium oryzae]|uniref:PepSY domain-containing protein n=1 Tax=Methanobacterium oryzae TaxID=69540 RepID=UPI003D2553DD
MKNKSVISLIAILVLIVSISGCVDNNQNTNNTNNNTQNTTQYNINQNTTKISSDEAKNIAQKYIEEPGATAGEPMLKDESGNPVYIVPIMQNNNIVGEIIIDAQTGENLGGAGGVSNTTK